MVAVVNGAVVDDPEDVEHDPARVRERAMEELDNRDACSGGSRRHRAG